MTDARMGHGNPFVTGDRTWTLGHRNTGDGLPESRVGVELAPSPPQPVVAPPASVDGPVRGNRRSRVYHLPTGCPSYNAVSPQNTVAFRTEAEAQAAGYRKAGNCR
jgi:deoxyribonuclease-1